MCSILAFADRNEIPLEITQQIERILAVSKTRGPDASGIAQPTPQAILASNRLSIVDTSPAGNMPISDDTGRYHITFNGEIYNHKELRKDLSEFNFKSNSDTEVLLYSLVKFGTAILPKLDGMFAFFFFDKLTGRVIIARDRLGIKPLYWGFVNETLVISSDIRAYLQIPGFNKAVSYEGLTSYITMRFIPAPFSIFKNVNKLLPGHFIETNVEVLKVEPEQYWAPKFEPSTLSDEELLATLAEKTKNAVAVSSMSDVDVAVLLSGGIDSSAVYAYSKALPKTINTYTCDFKTIPKEEKRPPAFQGTSLIYEEQSEKKFAEQLIADHKDTLNTVTVDLTKIVEVFEAMVWDLGEPIASTDALGNYLLAKNLPSQKKVLLTGTGADELLGGYAYLFLDGGEFLKSKPTATDFLARFSNPYNPKIDLSKILNPNIAKGFERVKELVISRVNSFPIEQYDDEGINYHMFFELLFDLPGWELDQADRIYMAFSKEIRPVFLQNDFVDLCLTIPSRLKLKNGHEKYIFKESLRGIIPDSIIDRRKHPSLGTPQSVFQTTWFSEKINLALKDRFGIINDSLPPEIVEQINNDFDLQYRLVVLDTWLSKVYA